MKFALKLASAAIALGVTGSAMAAAGDIFVDVYDPKTGTSIILDSGLALVSAATPGILKTDTLTGFADWTTFANSVTAAGGSLANLQFIATAATGTTRNGAFNQSFSTPNPTAVGFPSLLATAQNFNSVVLNAGDSIQSAASANALAWANLVGPLGNYGGTLVGGTGTALIGSTMGLYAGTFSGAVAGQVTAVTLSGTTLTIGTAAAVPEPGTYGLMMAGLLAVGAIVRRRSRA